MASTNSDKLLPKRIAGVKIPKKVRKGAEGFAALLTTPEARKVAADILIAVAGVLAADRRPAEADAPSPAKTSDEGAATSGMGTHAAGPAETFSDAESLVSDVVVASAHHLLPGPMTGAQDGSGVIAKRKKRAERASSH